MPLPLDWICQHGYSGLFWALLFVPFPGETLLTFAGYLIFKGQMQLAPALLAACLGTAGGISISYGLGRTLGHTLLAGYGARFGLTEKKVERARDWFEYAGRWSLLACFFVPGMRDVIGFTAGATGLRLPVFALFAYPGGAAWPAAYIALGYYLGDGWVHASEPIRQGFQIGGAVVASLLLLWCLWSLARRLRRRKQGAPYASPR